MLKGMGVGTKVQVGFALLLLILMTCSGITYFSVLQVAAISAVAEATSRSTLSATRMEDALDRRISGIRGYLLTGKDKERAAYEAAKQDFSAATEQLRNLLVTGEGRQFMARSQQLSQDYAAAIDHVAELRASNHAQQAADLYFGPQVAQLRSEVHDAIVAQTAFQENRHEQAQEELQAVEDRVRTLVVGLGIAGLGLGATIAFLLGRWFKDSVMQIMGFVGELREKDLSIADLRVTSQDEIGQTFAALNTMKNSWREMIHAIATTAEHMAGASDELNITSQQITANSEETSAQAQAVSDTTQHVSQNLQTVATGAEQMGASIREIAKNATEAARIATSAVKVAKTTTATISQLGDSSNQIGQVIKVITSIAQQTNLLALNATIEAARAGEAGKGFAVVANEVKELAKETARATEDISRKIEAIQSDTQAAVVAIASISEVINQINDISSTIATAVEEQNATTNEMSRNVSEAALGSGEITSNISGVAQAAESTSRGASDTQRAARQLVETSAELRRLVEKFKTGDGESGHENGMAPIRAQSRAAHAGL